MKLQHEYMTMETYHHRHNCAVCSKEIKTGEKYHYIDDIDDYYNSFNQNHFVIICFDCLARDDLEERQRLGEILISIERL